MADLTLIRSLIYSGKWSTAYAAAAGDPVALEYIRAHARDAQTQALRQRSDDACGAARAHLHSDGDSPGDDDGDARWSGAAGWSGTTDHRGDGRGCGNHERGDGRCDGDGFGDGDGHYYDARLGYGDHSGDGSGRGDDVCSSAAARRGGDPQNPPR